MRRDLAKEQQDGGQQKLFEDSYDSEVEEVFFGRPKANKTEKKEEDEAGKVEAKKAEEVNNQIDSSK